MQTPIKIDHLSQRYGKRMALTDVSLTIGHGLTGLLGRNGAGKTTLMKTMVTLLTPYKGDVTILGTTVRHAMEVRKLVGYLPQEFSMYPSMKVWEALDYLGILSNMPKALRRNRIDQLLSQVNLSVERNKKVRALSGGMKRRLGVAQALLHDPAVVIADEPTVGLDPEERVRLRELLMKVAEEKTVLLSTHIVEDIEATCPNVAILDGGKLLYAGSVTQLIERTGADSIETAYLRAIQAGEVPACS